MCWRTDRPSKAFHQLCRGRRLCLDRPLPCNRSSTSDLQRCSVLDPYLCFKTEITIWWFLVLSQTLLQAGKQSSLCAFPLVFNASDTGDVKRGLRPVCKLKIPHFLHVVENYEMNKHVLMNVIIQHGETKWKFILCLEESWIQLNSFCCYFAAQIFAHYLLY